MKYAKEVIDLLAAYPGREFRMIQIVRHVAEGQPANTVEWERLRKGVRRVLGSLEDSGQVVSRSPHDRSGSYSLYCWKPGHAVLLNRDRMRDNTCRTIAS